MRDKNHSAAEGRQRVEQHVLGAHVEVIGGLVKQKKIRWRNENPRQRVAIALAAAQHAQRFENIVAAEKKTTQQRPQCLLRNLERSAADVVENARIAVEHLILVLRKVFAHNIVAQFDPSARGCFGPSQELD